MLRTYINIASYIRVVNHLPKFDCIVCIPYIVTYLLYMIFSYAVYLANDTYVATYYIYVIGFSRGKLKNKLVTEVTVALSVVVK